MSESDRYAGRVGLQQRLLPDYRLAFVDRLAVACEGGLEVYAGEPQPGEAIVSRRDPQRARWVRADNQHLLGGPLVLLRQPGLSSWVDEWNPSDLILEANPRYVSNWRVARRARERGRKVIGWGLGAPGIESAFIGWIWRAFVRQFDALIAYSSLGAEQYMRAGAPPDRVFVALNAVVDGPTRSVERSSASGRPVRVLFVGRLQERKRVDLLLRACARASEPLELRIVGDGPARAQLERLAESVLPHAEFDGVLRGAPLDEAFRWADLFVLPGTGGLAVQQAMAHGLPVVVAQGDGTQRDLVDDSNGWLVPADDLELLTETLEQALAEPEELLERGRASRARVEQRVNLDAMVATFVRALRQAEGG